MVTVHLRKNATKEAGFSAKLTLFTFDSLSEFCRNVTESYVFVPPLKCWLPMTSVTQWTWTKSGLSYDFQPSSVCPGHIFVHTKEGDDVSMEQATFFLEKNGIRVQSESTGQKIFVPKWNVKYFKTE